MFHVWLPDGTEWSLLISSERRINFHLQPGAAQALRPLCVAMLEHLQPMVEAHLLRSLVVTAFGLRPYRCHCNSFCMFLLYIWKQSCDKCKNCWNIADSKLSSQIESLDGPKSAPLELPRKNNNFRGNTIPLLPSKGSVVVKQHVSGQHLAETNDFPWFSHLQTPNLPNFPGCFSPPNPCCYWPPSVCRRRTIRSCWRPGETPHRPGLGSDPVASLKSWCFVMVDDWWWPPHRWWR